MSLKLVQQATSSTIGIGQNWDPKKFEELVKGVEASKTYRDILDFILSVDGGKDWLAGFLSANIVQQPEVKITGSPTSMEVFSKQSASAQVSVASLIFYYQVALDTEACGGKHPRVKAGGLGSPGGGAIFGTLWYDDCNALQGGCDVQFNITSVAANVNFIRNGYTFAYFVGGGIGTVNAIGGGTCTW